MAPAADTGARYEVLSGYDSPVGPMVVVERFPQPGLLQQLCHRLGVLTKITAVAVLLSYVAPVGSELPPPYDKLSSLVGWTYFLLWSVSFYPQLLSNCRRQSVEGLSLDFLAMNVAGFGCYTVFNLALAFAPQVQQEYAARFSQGTGAPVELNDVFFAVHAFMLSLLMALQCSCYERGSQRVHFGTWLGLGLALGAAAAAALHMQLHGEGPEYRLTWLDLAYYCSYVKMGVTLIKFVPQVQMNAARRSTAGWSLDNVLLDLGGGILSIGQLLLSCLTLEEWSLITGNPVKLGLGLTSIGFDCVFVLQHLVYKGSPATTPARVEAAWFGELAVGYKACGVLHCPCPCPRCRYPGTADSSDYAAIAVVQQLAAFGPMRCICTHGAADGFTPLASQFYRGAYSGSLNSLARALPDAYDFSI
uniref:Cystinosin n=1 Tax=Tetradesmus obliquus TaxID=3088 RepID=A0A383VDK0_TETOB|eukprot:jgi/Sobl393_1/11449/SZX63020.1